MPPLDDGVESGKEIESTDEHSKQRVGYSHPPIATRFRKGQSGNPKGRPKGAKNLKTLLRQALNEKITVNENGKRRAITKMQAGVKQLANKVASGDVKTTLRLVDLHYRDEELERATNGAESGSLASSLPESATANEKLREITERLRARLAKRNASAS
jgi:hypothetical protein